MDIRIVNKASDWLIANLGTVICNVNNGFSYYIDELELTNIIRYQYCKVTCRNISALIKNFPKIIISFCTDDPEFTSVSVDQVVFEGGPSITLECIPIGEPQPNITWTRVHDNGSDSNVLFTGEQLVLDNNRSSIGTYRCTANNGIGTAPNRTIAVDVICKLCIAIQTKTTNYCTEYCIHVHIYCKSYATSMAGIRT